MSRRQLTDDEQDAYAEAFYGEAPVPGLSETPRDVLVELVELYRQAKQDACYLEWGQDWPINAAVEDQVLKGIHLTCADYLARYDAAAARQAT